MEQHVSVVIVEQQDPWEKKEPWLALRTDWGASARPAAITTKILIGNRLVCSAGSLLAQLKEEDLLCVYHIVPTECIQLLSGWCTIGMTS